MPVSASSGVSPKLVQAMFSAISGERTGDVPGLQSVAIAMDTPAWRRAATGGFLPPPRKYQAQGNNTATVPAAAIAAIPLSLTYSRWSAESARYFPAIAAPP